MSTTLISPLKAARQARAWTIQDVARESGLDPATISRIERGTQWPTRDKLTAILRTFPDLSERDVLFPNGSDAA